MLINRSKYLLAPGLLLLLISCSTNASSATPQSTLEEPAIEEQSKQEAAPSESVSELISESPSVAAGTSTQELARLRTESYATAIESLSAVEQETPTATEIAKRLVEYPEQTALMFDGCVFSEDYGDTGEREIQAWTQFYSHIADRGDIVGVEPLSDTTALVTIPCQLGPYWTATANYIYDISEETPQIEELYLPTYQPETQTVVPTATNVTRGFQSYDAETKEFNWSHRFAGHGGCGFKAVYTLENEVLELVQYNGHDDCTDPIPPDDFPQLYSQS